jgi:hypothetical protein
MIDRKMLPLWAMGFGIVPEPMVAETRITIAAESRDLIFP